MQVTKKILGIAGGCFPVQENIPAEELYHSIISRRLKAELNISPEISIIRYDTLKEGFDKTMELLRERRPDVLLFHTRPDPFLHNVKLYFRFINRLEKPAGRLNLHFSGFSEPELVMKIIPGTGKKIEGLSNKLFRTLNYISGIILLNYFITVRNYLNLISGIKAECLKKGISLVVQGPPSRPRSALENMLLRKFADKCGLFCLKNDIEYVDCFGEYDLPGKNYIFYEDKIHLNAFGHKWIAGKLFPALKKAFFTKTKNINPII